MGNKILVAFDDSENAMRAVELIARTFTRDREITLLSIVADTASVCDMQGPSLTPYFLTQKSTFCAMEDKKREALTSAQKSAKDCLVQAGFDPARVHTRIDTQKKSVAKDLLEEAASGYDTIVMGRRGHSGLTEFLMGSTSQKIIHSVKDISVVIVD